MILPTIDINFSYIEGTCRYCSPQAAGTIREKLRDVPSRAIHRIGNGDYHYISLFFLEKIAEPFTLYLYDNHPDNQTGAFDAGLLSCGNWVAEAERLPLCKGVVWTDGKGVRHERGEKCPAIYVSVDLDILSRQWMRTNWDQGDLTLAELCGILKEDIEGKRLLGADICGAPALGQKICTCELEMNGRCVREVGQILDIS